MPIPNFFIVGAPKCGTTALSHYLRDHPNVFMCSPKEPFYFAKDFPNFATSVVKTKEQYIALYSNATANEYVIGEASAIYLYSKIAISEISKFSPDAKIIVMLRNPVDLICSIHSQLLYSRDEEIQDLQEAWQLIDTRRQGHKIPPYCRDSKMLYYDEIAKLGDQNERVIQAFPENQVKIIFSEELFKRTKECYNDVLKYLDLPRDNRNNFPKINQNKRHRINWLANITQYPPKKLTNYIMKIKAKAGIRHIGVLGALRKANRVESPRSALPEDFRKVIVESYYDDIVKLSKLTGRNLDHWINYK